MHKIIGHKVLILGYLMQCTLLSLFITIQAATPAQQVDNAQSHKYGNFSCLDPEEVDIDGGSTLAQRKKF